tara:strand:+ start:17421 stop:18746 length:1326 start_codon:yes stop_codon:yes gene_type:complete
MKNSVISKKFNLPINWEIDILDNLTNKIVDGAHHTPKYTNSGIPFLRVTDVQTKEINFSKIKFISKQEHQQLIARCNPEKGDMLLSKNGSIGISKIVDWDWEFSVFVSLALIKVKKELDVQFLSHFFKSEITMWQILRRAKQGTVTNLHLEEIREIEIPRLSLPHQQKIAKILFTIDNVIEKTESAIAKYQAIKQGLMHDLFTRGIDLNTGRLRPTPQEAPALYKESVLGLIPRDWELENFEEATEIITDFTANGSFESLRVNVKYYYEVNYGRLIRLTDLRQNLQTDGVYVNKSGFEFLLKSELRENDIMLANVGEYTGFACLMPKVNYPATIAPNMFLVRTDKEKFDSKFMYYFMTYPQFTTQVDNVSASSATKLLNKTNFRAMHIPKPKIEEQVLFSKKIESLDQKIQTEQQTLAKYQQLKAGLLQDLLTGKVAVGVD